MTSEESDTCKKDMTTTSHSDEKSNEVLAGEESINVANHPKAGSIEAIDYKSVHRICSGQVVLTLATAVKELVENSIDAGATKVEIKLKEYGSELIEVVDNGSGVAEENFEGLTLKHHTSKLRDFSDLSAVETFGFRGEALSSLCALSNLAITTRHKASAVATKLEYDHHGKITSKSHCARQQGTTITLENLFCTLPVRFKEFQRNLKKEFCKMVNVLNAYCIVNVNVRLTCHNQTGKGSKNAVVSSLGNSSMKENIGNIFGLKQLQTITEIVQIEPNEEISEEFGIKMPESAHNLFKIEGFVSKCDHNLGRSTSDRQFFFINKRPCDFAKMSKVVNDVYHMYNRHQYPFVVLHVNIAKESVDVNVTPDKRQVFLENEKLLLAIIKASLVRMYEPTSSVFNVNQLKPLTKFDSPSCESQQSNSPLQSPQNHENTGENQSLSRNISSLAQLKRSFSRAFVKDDSIDASPSSKSTKLNREKQRQINASPNEKSKIHADGILKWMTSKHKSSETDSTKEKSSLNRRSSSSLNEDLDSSRYNNNDDDSLTSSPTEKVLPETMILTPHTLSFDCSPEISKGDKPRRELSSPPLPSLSVYSHNETLETDAEDEEKKFNHHKSFTDEQEHDEETCENTAVTLLDFDSKTPCQRKERSMVFSLASLQRKLEKIKENKGTSGEAFCRSFRAKISPGENEAAEEELQKYIDKKMFEQMEILGQFNLGFIIARLNDDLFIIDQHATDEKYNFEVLRKQTVMQGQKLICPQNLELTASNEIILIDNLEIFKKNGFDFVVDELSAPGQRVKLLTAPVSKNWNFGKEDIEELIFMLKDSPGVMCRPSRIRQMFASRACRKSVMIGTSLDKREMKKLVHHMSELDQPWNCPHGRPTMRHLINLNMLPST